MPLFSVKWYLKSNFIKYSSHKKMNQNIPSKKEQRKLTWESWIILASIIVAIVLVGVKEGLIWKEK